MVLFKDIHKKHDDLLNKDWYACTPMTHYDDFILGFTAITEKSRITGRLLISRLRTRLNSPASQVCSSIP